MTSIDDDHKKLKSLPTNEIKDKIICFPKPTLISKRVIQFQSLPTKKTTKNPIHPIIYEHVGIYWRSRVCRDYKTCPQCNVLTFDQTGDANIYICGGNGLYMTFVKAYENRKGIILSPEDIWIQVLFQFSTYICKNDRHQFGERQEITTNTANIELILAEVTKNNPSTLKLFQNDFTTTQSIHKFISSLVINANANMDSNSSTIKRKMTSDGGINQVEFLGSLQDWANLYHRVNRLINYDVNGTWNNYITGVTAIISKWYLTYQGIIDVEWWNQLPTWILDLFGPYEETPSSRELSVSITINDRKTSLKTGFSGIEYTNEFYRPQLSFALIDICAKG